MMRLEIRLHFGHTRFPSAEELALGEALSLSLFRKAKAFIEGGVGHGTDYGSVYSDFEFQKRDYKKVMSAIEDVLQKLSVRNLAKITEKPPMSSYDELEEAKQNLRKSRSPLKNGSPPTYLVGKVRRSLGKGPARRLFSGNWCGHGQDTFLVFDIVIETENSFRVLLPQSDDEELNPQLVLAVSKKDRFPLYDSREHVASVYSDKEYHRIRPRLRRYFHCPKCDSQNFQLAVGFEVGKDREGPNDTSWFALAGECMNCNWTDLIYDDETQ